MTKKVLGRGDIISISSSPKPSGNSEQRGRRPWLVVSEQLVNRTSPFVIAIPFTTTVRNYPLVYSWDKQQHNSKTGGTLLCNQLTALDVNSGDWSFVEKVEVPVEVDTIIQAMFGYK